MKAKTLKAVLILTVMALASGFQLLTENKAYSQGTIPTLSHEGEPECGDSDGDGQCDSNTQMD
jgi:hypothetical protein